MVLSQAVEYAQLLKDTVAFDFCFFLCLGDYIRKRKELPGFSASISAKTGGRVYFIPAFIKFDRFSVMLASIMFMLFLFRFSGRRIVIHARGEIAATLAQRANLLMKNVGYIFDMRGDTLAEFRYSYANILSKRRIEQIVKRRNRLQKKSAFSASKVICVSNALKSLTVKRWNLNPEKIFVLPCAVTGSRFAYNSELRHQMRQRLLLDNKFVLIYCGGIGYWHYSTELFKMAGHLMKEHEDVFFISLSPDDQKASALAENFLPRGRYLSQNAKREEVPSYLMASDMGILLREKDPLNRVASPTKFAEYISAGLSVIISEEVGDYSGLVKSLGLGIVLNDPPDREDYSSKFDDFHRTKAQLNRENISNEGLKRFSKEKYLSILKGIYTGI